MKVTFVGTTACTPEIGSEVASFMINDNILVDTGWYGVMKMREHGFDPGKLEYLILTHLHQDHYMGLPQIVFWKGIKQVDEKGKKSAPLTIIGPSQHLETIVNSVMTFLQVPRFHELAIDFKLVPLKPGESFKTEHFQLDTFASRHMSGVDRQEEALTCKYAEPASGKSFVFTGDTSYHPPIAEFAKNASVLIHDACHTQPKDVAAIGKMADAGKLYLIHCTNQNGPAALKDAQAIFPRSFLAREGEVIAI
ncbi:MAG: MBL fold metallo-hydrolase [Verrucomicrobiae bacterium]|nr:MBL fold metallo-hydrolase [Verrucomicrobiae bacterium]